MDENPYKAPEQGGGRPGRSHVSPRRLLDLVAVVVAAVVVVFLLCLLVAPLVVPPIPLDTYGRHDQKTLLPPP